MPAKFEVALPKTIPRAVRVYQLQPPKVTAKSLETAARRLGIAGPNAEVLTSTDSLVYIVNRWRLEMHLASGALSLTDTDKYGIDPKEEFNVADKRAQAIAKNFLVKTKLIPFASARPLKVTHLRSADADVKTREVNERVVDAGVVYGRLVDKLPVTGPGGFTMVNVNNEAKVVGARSVWRTLGKSLAQVKIKPVETAVADFEKAVSRIRGDVTVVKAEFGYFEQGIMDRQTVMEPAYAFVFIVRDGGIASKHAHVVHAGDKTFGKLIGPKRFPAPTQRARKD